MSTQEIAAGKSWVLDQLRRKAADVGVPVDSARWVETSDGFREGFELLLVVSEGREFSEKFTEEHLEDCDSTPSVRAQLAYQIQMLLMKVDTRRLSQK